MKKSHITALSLMAILLSSCGGFTKSSKISCSTLNCNGEFHINVPVYQGKENVTYFKFQDGYSMDDLKNSLKDDGHYYEEYGDELFINAIVNDKSEYFLIRISDENEKTYFIESTSCFYLSSAKQYRKYLLLPYFLLANKSDYQNIYQYCNYSNTDEIHFNVTCDYRMAKILYSQTDQIEIDYDDENETIWIFNDLKMVFNENVITLSKQKRALA